MRTHVHRQNLMWSELPSSTKGERSRLSHQLVQKQGRRGRRGEA